jgi:hypothetical protein
MCVFVGPLVATVHTLVVVVRIGNTGKQSYVTLYIGMFANAGRQGIAFSVSGIFEGFRIIECESRGLKPKA